MTGLVVQPKIAPSARTVIVASSVPPVLGAQPTFRHKHRSLRRRDGQRDSDLQGFLVAFQFTEGVLRKGCYHRLCGKHPALPFLDGLLGGVVHKAGPQLRPCIRQRTGACGGGGIVQGAEQLLCNERLRRELRFKSGGKSIHCHLQLVAASAERRCFLPATR